MDNDKTKKDFLYCNQMQISVSPWDFIFSFQRMAHSSTTNKPELAEAVEVAMSPAHVKLVVASIYEVLEAYEENSGKIALDKTSQAKYDKFVQQVKKLP